MEMWTFIQDFRDVGRTENKNIEQGGLTLKRKEAIWRWGNEIIRQPFHSSTHRPWFEIEIKKAIKESRREEDGRSLFYTRTIRDVTGR